MVILGLLLLLTALAIMAFFVLSTMNASDRLNLSAFSDAIQVNIDPLWIFLAGVLSTLLLMFSFWLMGAGTRASARKRRENKELRQQAAVRRDEERLQAERTWGDGSHESVNVDPRR